MQEYETRALRVAIPISKDGNGIAEAIYVELEALGYQPEYFMLDGQAPANADVLFLFGPFDKFLHLLLPYRGKSPAERPTLAFWNTEGLPDPRLPWPLVGPAAVARSWLDRLGDSDQPLARRFAATPAYARLEPRFLRFRYLGDYLYAFRHGLMDVFADISAVYAQTWRQRGLPALVAPFGSHQAWYQNLTLERDIDVLWMGKRATQRRSQALDHLRAELNRHGVDIYMVDNEEKPFVFGEERTQLLNRSKITLNLLRTWYDENSLRICMAAPNRSLVVSEPLLAHVPQYQADIHYVSAPLETLAETILFYLQNEPERERIVENAYELSTCELTFRSSMKTVMDAVEQARAARWPADALSHREVRQQAQRVRIGEELLNGEYGE